MKLGILVNSDRNFAAVVGLASAAVNRGHEVIIFAMDTGTAMLADPACVALAGVDSLSMSYCEHSAAGLKVITEGLPAAIESSSQYNNAGMNHNADKVIVL